jgi:RNA ligase
MTTAFPSGAFQAAEKMDGSLGVAFCYEGTWQVATRGSFQSSQAEWATEWFQSNMSDKISSQHCGATILVEIIYPDNQIVIDYDFSGLVLLGAYHANGREYSRSELEELATEVGIRLAKLYQFASVADVLQSATILPGDKEGWVLHFPSGYRMKIKGDEYCNLHRSHSMCTPLNIWNVMKSNEDMIKFAESMPEEFAADLGKIVQSLDEQMEECLEILNAAIQAAYHLSPKELGLLSPNSKKKLFPNSTNIDSLVEINIPSEAEEETTVIPAWTLPFHFQSRKKEFQNGVMLDLIRHPRGNLNAQRLREKLFDRFRPMNNCLNGYSPTGVANRFVDRLDEKRSNQATVP